MLGVQSSICVAFSSLQDMFHSTLLHVCKIDCSHKLVREPAAYVQKGGVKRLCHRCDSERNGNSFHPRCTSHGKYHVISYSDGFSQSHRTMQRTHTSFMQDAASQVTLTSLIPHTLNRPIRCNMRGIEPPNSSHISRLLCAPSNTFHSPKYYPRPLSAHCNHAHLVLLKAAVIGNRGRSTHATSAALEPMVMQVFLETSRTRLSLGCPAMTLEMLTRIST